MHELGDSPEMSFKDVLSEAGTCDLILVEGFKREPFPKIELRREGSASRQPLTGVPEIIAVASDRPGDETDSSLSSTWMIYEEFPISLPDISTLHPDDPQAPR